MGSTEETPKNSSDLYDSSTSPIQQPLLSSTSSAAASASKPPLPPPPFFSSYSSDHQTPPQPETDHTKYLQITYNYSRRPIKDLPFLILFALFVLSTFGFGIFAAVNRNPSSSAVSSFSYDFNSTSCVQKRVSFDSPSFLPLNSILSLRASSSDIVKNLVWTLVITLILSIPFAFCVLLLLKHSAKQLVYFSLPFFVIVPIFIDIYWFIACTINSTCSLNFALPYRIMVLVFVLLVVGVIVWIFVVNWHRIELTVMIIQVASDALSKHLGLFIALPCLTLGLLAYFAPIVVFLVFARLNGEIVPREKNGEYYCAWKEDSWVPAYYALAILTMLWSAAAMVEAQVYVISGTIAQWYFSKEDSTQKRSIRSSLRNAFGPSSGTICLSGLLVGVVRLVRVMVDSASNEDASGIVNLILRCCVNALLAAIDFLNKFTIIFAAMTGEAYCTSARMTYELLRRNLLSAALVEVISTRLLAGVIFVFSAIYAIVVCAILNAVSNLGAEAYFVGAMAWLLLVVVLGFLIHVLDNVIDTVYICYAIDRDKGEVCNQDVHEVYVHLPISRNHRTPLDPRTPLLV